MPQTQVGNIHLESQYDEERGTVVLTATRGEDRHTETMRVSSQERAETMWHGWQYIYREWTDDLSVDHMEWPDA